jgi:hypothetical protein
MIVDSDNKKANDVLAAVRGGTSVEDAYYSTLDMNAMLRDLGFEFTYMNVPYESANVLTNERGFDIPRGPPRQGSPPYTNADPSVRTTPAEISRLFLLIDECSTGVGELLIKYPDTLTPERCQEMLDLLARNADTERIVAGVPDDVRVEHKSGWVSDMHADVGIVRSPGGDYLLAVNLWRNTRELPAAEANERIQQLSRLVYTAFNPELE